MDNWNRTRLSIFGTKFDFEVNIFSNSKDDIRARGTVTHKSPDGYYIGYKVDLYRIPVVIPTPFISKILHNNYES